MQNILILSGAQGRKPFCRASCSGWRFGLTKCVYVWLYILIVSRNPSVFYSFCVHLSHHSHFLELWPIARVFQLCQQDLSLGLEIECKLMSRLPVNFSNVQIWAHLGASKWWGHSVLQTPALVFFSVGLVVAELCPFFDPFSTFLV